MLLAGRSEPDAVHAGDHAQIILVNLACESNFARLVGEGPVCLAYDRAKYVAATCAYATLGCRLASQPAGSQNSYYAVEPAERITFFNF